MKSLALRSFLAAALMLASLPALAEDKAPAKSWSQSVQFPAGEKPMSIFPDAKFTGWEGHTGKYFTLDGDVVVARNTKADAPKVSTYLLTTKSYKNFRLVFEGKLAESGMHSGIAIWGKKFEKDGETHSYQGHLVMFPAGWGFYDLYRRNMIYPDPGPAKAADNKDWNRMEILAVAPRIRLAVNGKLVADWTDPKPELCVEGPIGLQLHSNTVPQKVLFRGLILSENPTDKMLTVNEE